MSSVNASVPSLAAGSVITSDYLPWARVTASSFAEHHPGVRFVVLVIDEPEPHQLRDEDTFELVRPEAVGLGAAELDWMDLIYDGLELCCALKPWLLRYLLADAQAALYLDSDLFVCGSLHDVAEQARRAGVVVSPHALEPRPTEGTMPKDDDLLQVGQFNAGFVAVGRSGGPFLEWWAARLARECTNWDPAVPLRFLDQRWLDLVLNYFPCEVHRDPGANLARWNLGQRRLELAGDRYEVDGRPLRFFHFSSFDPRNPSVLSPLQRPHPRTDLARSPALRQLVEDYHQRLISAGWQPRVGERPVPVRGGVTLTPPVRSALRAALIESERLGVAPAAGPGDPERLVSWLRAPATPNGMSWYLWGLWASCRAARAAFPHIPGADEQRYLAWSLTEGVALGLVPAQLAGAAGPLGLHPARRFVALVEAGEVLQDPTILAELADTFGPGGELALLLRAPGWDPAALVGDLDPLLAEFGLDGPDAPEMLALLDAAAPSAVAPLIHAVLTRRAPDDAFLHVPRASDAANLRRLADEALGNARRIGAAL